MTSIVALYPNTPVWLRTPKWFISRYLELYRDNQGSRWGRLFGIPDSGNRSPEAPEPGEFIIGTPTKLPRQLRALGEKEVSWLFGSHVEWIVLQFHCLRRHVVDIPSWLEFADSTFRARRADTNVARRDEYDGLLSATQRYEVDVRHLVRCRSRVYPTPDEPAEDESMVSIRALGCTSVIHRGLLGRKQPERCSFELFRLIFQLF